MALTILRQRVLLNIWLGNTIARMVRLLILMTEYAVESLQDADMKVRLPLLKRAYLALQEKDENSDDGDMLDPEDHLYFIDAYEMPQWHWSSERNTFEK